MILKPNFLSDYYFIDSYKEEGNVWNTEDYLSLKFDFSGVFIAIDVILLPCIYMEVTNFFEIYLQN